MTFIKEKAIFMILILIIATISFSIGLSDVEAVEAQTNSYCCEELNDGNSCMDIIDTSLCKSSNPPQLACSQTNFCEKGCCYNTKSGESSENVPKATCNGKGTDWNWVSGRCNVVQDLSYGCCILPYNLNTNEGGCMYITKQACSDKIKDYPGLSLTNTFITQENGKTMTQTMCTNKCQESEKGCCVFGIGDCKFTTLIECNTKPHESFESNELCSNIQKCGAIKQFDTKCVNNKVYWVDNNENLENIYEGLGTANLESSYNNGRVKVSTCDGENNLECGNCDYSKGFSCTAADENFLNSLSDKYPNDPNLNRVENMCKEKICTDSNGNKRIEGETWCEYDAAVGLGRDLPGSSHYVMQCINGEVKKLPCASGRGEICVQDKVKSSNVITNAKCRPNLWFACLTCNAEGIEDKKGCCDKLPTDCYWFESYADKIDMCLPSFPPGKNADFGTDDLKAEKTCDFSFTCTEAGRKGYFSGDFNCEDNCFCGNEYFRASMNNLCSSMGDCGAGYNVAGDFNNEGWSVIRRKVSDYDKRIFKITEGDIDWNDFKEANLIIVTGVQADENPPDTVDALNIEGFGAGSLWNFEWWSEFSGWATVLGSGVGITIIAVISAVTLGVALLVIIAVWLQVKIYEALTKLVLGKPIRRTYTYSCEEWQPPAKSDNCGYCMENGRKCDEYLCTSLGKNCKYNSEEEICYSLNINDIAPPNIEPLLVFPVNKNDYIEKDGNSGYTITYTYPKYTEVKFGIKTTDDTDDNTRCRISKTSYGQYLQENPGYKKEDFFNYQLENTFSNNGNRPAKEHIFTIPVGDFNDDSTDINIIGGGEYIFYIACADFNDNIKSDYYVKLNVEVGPDENPPLIEYWSLKNPVYVKEEVSELPIKIYVNEMVEGLDATILTNYEDEEGNIMDESYESNVASAEGGCRFSRDATTLFDDMSNMTCYSDPVQTNPNRYLCEDTLKDLNVNENNVFYFKCKDLAGNINGVGYPDNSKEDADGYNAYTAGKIEQYGFYVLKTQPLAITINSPQQNSVITDPLNTNGVYYTNLDVTVSGGDGNAVCTYKLTSSPTGNSWTNGITLDKNNNKYTKKINLERGNGAYTYEVKCRDGTADEKIEQLSFSLNKQEYFNVNVNVNSAKRPVELLVTTDKVATCLYAQASRDRFGDLVKPDLTNMKEFDQIQANNKGFFKDLGNLANGAYTYYIYCSATDGSIGEKDIDFNVNIVAPPVDCSTIEYDADQQTCTNAGCKWSGNTYKCSSTCYSGWSDTNNDEICEAPAAKTFTVTITKPQDETTITQLPVELWVNTQKEADCQYRLGTRNIFNEFEEISVEPYNNFDTISQSKKQFMKNLGSLQNKKYTYHTHCDALDGTGDYGDAYVDFTVNIAGGGCVLDCDSDNSCNSACATTTGCVADPDCGAVPGAQCVINSISWVNKDGTTINMVNGGETVYAVVSGSNCNVGDSLIYTIYEKDILVTDWAQPDDLIKEDSVEIANKENNIGSALIEWVATRQSDNFDPNNKYYIKINNKASSLLEVKEGVAIAQCNDNIDNDNDGCKDLADSDCSSATDTSESGSICTSAVQCSINSISWVNKDGTTISTADEGESVYGVIRGTNCNQGTTVNYEIKEKDIIFGVDELAADDVILTGPVTFSTNNIASLTWQSVRQNDLANPNNNYYIKIGDRDSSLLILKEIVSDAVRTVLTQCSDVCNDPDGCTCPDGCTITGNINRAANCGQATADTIPPRIIQIVSKSTKNYIETNEKAICYSSTNNNGPWNNALAREGSSNRHLITSTGTYYIQCVDQPAGNKANIISITFG